MSEDITLDEYNGKPIMLKVFGKDRLIDLRKRRENEPTYSVILPTGEEIIFGKGENGFKELEKFGYVFL